MDIQRLFKVLVVGGSMLGVSACTEPEPATDSGTPQVDASEADASEADASEADASEADAGAPGDVTECGFCPNDICCDEAGELREGLGCCWGTSC